MADPFEVRVRFTSMLQHLNASVTAAQKTANYALRFRDLDEDLQSCILEQLEMTNMNTRANIMYFIEHLCEAAQRDNHPPFLIMTNRDIAKIADCVVPRDGSGAANIKVARKVLQGLQSRSVIEPATVAELEVEFKKQDVPHSKNGVTNGENGVGSGHSTGAKRRHEGMNGSVRPDNRAIEQRIEQDRERHKRLRENIWTVSGVGDDELIEMDMAGTEGYEDDGILIREDVEERDLCPGCRLKD